MNVGFFLQPQSTVHRHTVTFIIWSCGIFFYNLYVFSNFRPDLKSHWCLWSLKQGKRHCSEFRHPFWYVVLCIHYSHHASSDRTPPYCSAFIYVLGKGYCTKAICLWVARQSFARIISYDLLVGVQKSTAPTSSEEILLQNIWVVYKSIYKKLENIFRSVGN